MRFGLSRESKVTKLEDRKMKANDFAKEAGIPTDAAGRAKPEIEFGYFSYLLKSPDGSAGVRLATLSKDFWLKFSKFSDETKARFITAAMSNAKMHQHNGGIFTIEGDGDDGQVEMLITLVELGSEFILHVEKR